MKNHRPFKEICRANHWRSTPQRLAIYGFVCDNLTHPGVDEVWEEVKQSLPAVTRESVYRILNEFAQAGIIQRLDHIASARYDSQTAPHGHFICEGCGEITDFSFPDGTALPVHPAAGSVRHIELRISGICDKCSRTTNHQEEKS